MRRKIILSIFQSTNWPDCIRENQDVIRTNYIKAKISKTRQNSKWKFYGERDETVNQIISKSSKLVQKDYKTRHDWVGKVIHWELCKRFKFDHTSKYTNQNTSKKWDAWNSLRFWNTKRSPNPDPKTRSSNNLQGKKMTL